jgi:hypothetical protein
MSIKPERLRALRLPPGSALLGNESTAIRTDPGALPEQRA